MPHRPSICALSRAPETTPRATYAADSCRSKPVAGAMRPPVNASHAGPEISDGEHIGQASWTGILHTPESLVAWRCVMEFTSDGWWQHHLVDKALDGDWLEGKAGKLE